MRNSLKGTIIDKISIDEFKPKSGVTEEVAVVAFYAIDDEPAQDLNTYIQRGYIDVIDAEVSPNPDVNGHYVVFVEIERNTDFLELFLRLVRDIENVTGAVEWQITPYSADHAFGIDDPDLVQHLTFGNVTESIKRFLAPSDLPIVLEKNNVNFGQVKGDLKDFGHVNRIMEKYSLEEAAIDLDSYESDALERMLGAQYQVSKYGSNVFIANSLNENAVVLSNLIFTHSR
jgi:hypothetical protein